MKSSPRSKHKHTSYRSHSRKHFQTNTSKNIERLCRKWKWISLYITIIVTLPLLAMVSRINSQILTSDVTASGFPSPAKIISTTSTTTTIAGDDNWKMGLYTNRTLGRDYDPLLVVYTNTIDMLRSSVNYSSRLFKTTAAEDVLRFNSCSGTTLRHHCQVKSSRVLQDLAFMAQMSMNLDNMEHQTTTGVQSLSPQVQRLIAMAAYGDEDNDFWESLSFLDILLRDEIHDTVPDKNR